MIKKDMRKLVNKSLEALESAQQANIGDESLNAFYMEVFSRLRTLQDCVDNLQRSVSGLDDLVTDRYNSDSRKFRSLQDS